MWRLRALRQTLHLSFRRAVSREESAVVLPKADFSPMNRLEMTSAAVDVVASGTETDPTFVIPTRGVARGICCGAAKSRFLADESARNDKGGLGCGGFGAPRQTLRLSFRSAVTREESAVVVPKADFSAMN